MIKWIKDLFKSKEEHKEGYSIEGVKLTTDKNNPGDYNPFFDGDNYLSDKPLTKQEMDEKGFISGEYICDVENGYYAWKYKK